MVFEQSSCNPDQATPHELSERIISKKIQNDSLFIVLGKREMCCAKFKASYTFAQDTLHIQYKNIGDQCFCTCFYEFTFKIPNVKNDTIKVLFNELSFPQNRNKLSAYKTTIDTLDNGNIVHTEYENDQKTFEVEDQDSITIYRQFYRGKLQGEKKIKQ